MYVVRAFFAFYSYCNVNLVQLLMRPDTNTIKQLDSRAMTCCRKSGESLYAALGLEKDCSQEDIKRAYRRVRHNRQFHIILHRQFHIILRETIIIIKNECIATL